MPESFADNVVAFYDTHPINEDEILAKLAARGDDLDRLTQDRLKDFDQDHYGGTEVVDILAERAGISAGHHVLDVCSGMGGPARWLAHTRGCRVTGLDFTQSRVEAARRLTSRVGMEQRVDFVHGDATAMPLPDAAFDIVVSQEAWLHIPDKAAVVGQCARVLKPGGTLAFTDVILRAPLTAQEESRLAAEMHAPGVASAARYLEILAAARLAVKSSEDLSVFWTETLVKRLAMYRSLRDTTVAKFGAAHFDAWDGTYAFFVGLFSAGRLGGMRVVAQKPH
ncbi:MAG: class I SAM-dependent methyltransferase [Burkholderiales bacterium]